MGNIVNSQNFDAASGSATLTGFSLGAGSNRVAAIILTYEQTNNSRQISALTVGGISFTRKGGHVHGSGSTYAYVDLWYALESAISGGFGTDPAVSATAGGGGVADCAGTIFTLSDVDQTAANWTEASDGDTAANAMSTTLTTISGGVVLGGQCCTSTGFSFTTDSPVTEVTSSDRNFTGALGSRVVAFYHTATGTSTAIGGDNGSTSGSAYQAIYAVGFTDASSGPAISSGTQSPENQFTAYRSTNLKGGLQ